MKSFKMPVDKAAVVSGAGVLIAACVAFGLDLSGEQTSAILGVVGLAALVWNWFVAQKTTVEYTASGSVYRGPANEEATGEYVRERGAIPPDPSRCHAPSTDVESEDLSGSRSF